MRGGLTPMPVQLKSPRPDVGARRPDPETVLAALALPVVALDRDRTITYANAAAEQMFQVSANHLLDHPLAEHIPSDSPIFALIAQSIAACNTVAEYGVAIETPRMGRHFVNLLASPLGEADEGVVIIFQLRSIADKIDRQLIHRGAARSVAAMAAMLAHEVKNPMAGIRGAAQLLEENAPAQDKALTQLIRDEADRVCTLVDRMDTFSAGGLLSREAVNIHEVLDRVRRIAESSFARHVRIVAVFDPSLPFVYGNRDQLIQVFLNLVKNAAEACPEVGGEIGLSTAYQQGVKFAVPGSNARVHLPLAISVRDNGEGIPEDIRGCLFDPFVTSKPKGSGLGLALVAKIIGDHGGVIEFDSRPRHTTFRIMLPMYLDESGRAVAGGDG
jgi:two-component system nitrogen regulation sensor histidine kinase GlnL